MKLLKVKEVMVKLGVSRGKVYQMINDRVILSVNIGGCIRVPEKLLDEMIYRQLIQAAGKDKARVERINNLFGDRAERREDEEWPVEGA